jgi:hypothetical protein
MVEQLLVAKIRSDSTITDLVGDRIYAGEKRQGESGTSIVYLMSAETPTSTQSGICLYDTIMLFDCLADSYAKVRVLSKALALSLDRYDNVSSSDTEILITRYKGIVDNSKEKDEESYHIVIEFHILNK